MIKKTSKTPSRDRRVISLNSKMIDVVSLDIANHTWLTIGQKFPKPHRKQLAEAKELITIFTSMYGSSLAQRQRTRSVSSVIQEIELWRKRTVKLRNSIWLSDPTEASEQSPTMETLLQSHFKPAVSKRRLEEPLDYFALFLDGVNFLADQYIKELADPSFKSARTSDLWIVWVALVIDTLKYHGVPVGTLSLPGIVALLDALQAEISKLLEKPTTTTANKSVRREFKEARKGGSLRKGIATALGLSDRFSTENLLAAFLSWSTGDYQAGEPRLEPSSATSIAQYITTSSAKGHDGKHKTG